MGICAGLAEPKSEHVKKALVLLLFFEGDIGSTVGSRERFRPHVRFAYRDCEAFRRRRIKIFCDFWLKMLRVYLQKYASYIGGEHIFKKIMKKGTGKRKNSEKA